LILCCAEQLIEWEQVLAWQVTAVFPLGANEPGVVLKQRHGVPVTRENCAKCGRVVEIVLFRPIDIRPRYWFIDIAIAGDRGRGSALTR
jgi:hypothetical protein